jgi:hypothetical protein
MWLSVGEVMMTKERSLLITLVLISTILAGCSFGPTETANTETPAQPDIEAIPSSTSTQTATVAVTDTPVNTITQTPCPGEQSYPSPFCFSIDIYLVGEDDPYLSGVEIGCGPSGEMVVRFLADIRITTDLELIKVGEREGIPVNFACLSQIDFQKMSAEDLSAAASFSEIKGQDDYYQRQWNKVDLTFVDGTVWEDVYTYDTCCYQPGSDTIEESQEVCWNPIGTGNPSDQNEGLLQDLDVAKLVIIRKVNCP